MDNDKILLNQIRKAGFDVSMLPRNMPLYFKHKQFVRVPSWVIQLRAEKVITDAALCLYIHIASRCYNNKSFMWASKSTLIKESGYGKSGVFKLLNDLIEAGIIAIFTQRMGEGDHRERSLICLMEERNMPGDNYVPSHRGNSHYMQKGKKKVKKAYAHRDEQDVFTEEESVCSPGNNLICSPDHTRSTGRTEEQEGEEERLYRPNFSDKKNYRKKLTDKEQNISNKTNMFVIQYYQWLYTKHDIKREPRLADYNNAYDMIDRIGLDCSKFLKYIHEQAPDDKYFKKSNKHLSVWLNSKTVAEFAMVEKEGHFISIIE